MQPQNNADQTNKNKEYGKTVKNRQTRKTENNTVKKQLAYCFRFFDDDDELE